MSQSTKEHKTSWAEIILGTVGITALQAVVTAGIARSLMRTSTENKKLTAAVRKITKHKRLRVFILAREDTLEAFVYSSGDIFITEELYKLLEYKEALAIALHEAGHVVLHAQTCISICKSGVFLTLLAKDSPFLVSLAASLLSGIGSEAWHERFADSYAMRLGYGPSLASALSKLYDNTEPVAPTLLDLPAVIGGKIDDLFRIHPEIGKRIEKLSS